MAQSDSPRVVIIGAGFGGLEATKTLGGANDSAIVAYWLKS